MSRKLVLLTALTIVLVGALGVAFNVQKVQASGTIYIRANGEVEGTDKIERVGEYGYIFTDNIDDSIVLERDNIVVDGTGYTVQGTGVYLSKGIDLTGRGNVTIKSMRIKSFWYGIWLNTSSSNNISGNNITDNGWYSIYLEHSSNNSIIENNIANNDEDGICLKSSSNNTIFGNKITNNLTSVLIESSSNNTISKNNIINNRWYGIELLYSSNNTISGNTISNNFGGIELKDSSTNTLTGNTISNDTWAIFLVNSGNNVLTGNTVSNNTYGINIGGSDNNRIFHNNFINNTDQVRFQTPMSYGNTWDNSYPSGGSYWTDYTGVDLDHDGIGDTAYDVYADNQDNYPLMGMFSDFNATSERHVQTVCNSTISDSQYNGTAISFKVTGEAGTAGFCRMCIPTALMSDYQVFVNGTEVSYDLLPPPISNSTHSYIYFSYEHSTKEVVIVPEFPSFILLLFMIATLLTVIVYRSNILKADPCKQHY